MITNPVGKKVNLIIKKGICSYEMSDEVCEIVSVIPWSKELNDYCVHYIVKGPDGKEKEVREVECVFSPDYSKRDIGDTIYSFLNDNGLWADVDTQMEGNVIVINISWGDWKHDHLWCKDLMQYLGYEQVSEFVTEENGSDCYSAEHTYIKAV